MTKKKVDELGRQDVPVFGVEDLGRVSYEDAYAVQEARRDAVLGWRGDEGERRAGVLLLVEHDPPVITVSRRASAGGNLLASAGELERLGVAVRETDRGGDITYHGPGQLVVYPVVDLNRLGLNLHGYLRFLEEVVIRVCAGFGVEAGRDESEDAATGVWVKGAKIAAMGVRVRRWVTMHGLALNVDPEMAHFDLIVPCGLAGRGVTSLSLELGGDAPSMDDVKVAIARAFDEMARQK